MGASKSYFWQGICAWLIPRCLESPQPCLGAGRGSCPPRGLVSMSPPHGPQCRFPFAPIPVLRLLTRGAMGLCPPCSAPPEQSNNNHLSCSCCGQKSLQQPGCSAGDALWAGSCEHLDPRECSNGRRVAGQISGDASHWGGRSSFRGVVLELGNASAKRLLSSLPTGIWVKRSFFQGHPGPG